MDKITFSLKPTSKKPPRTYSKTSKYDHLLDAFLSASDNLVTVSVKGKSAHNLKNLLKTRIESRNLENIDVSVVNNVCYLERVKS